MRSPVVASVLPRWPGQTCIVAATGPSLTAAVAEQCKGRHVIAVNDAYRLMPYADVLYACDARWWDLHDGCRHFAGERWSSHDHGINKKFDAAARYGLKLVRGGNGEGFSFNPSFIHYGKNSGFQAVNLALLFGAVRVLLIGFDMGANGRRHFFGDHPKPLANYGDFARFIEAFSAAAKRLPKGIEIINCTPGSALTCFRMADLRDELSD